jgi:hypothetical protein
MEDGSTTETWRRKAEEEMGWLVSNKWLTIITTPSPVFLKVLISGGFKFFRKNTFKSVDSAWFIGASSLDKSNFRGFGGEGGKTTYPFAAQGKRARTGLDKHGRE